MFTGLIIKESLQDTSVLERLLTNNMRTVHVDNPASDQPSIWTLYNFEIPDTGAAEIAQDFAEILKEGTWYIDMNNGKRYYIIFAKRVFEHEKSDEVGKALAKEYARKLGIPEKQLDWK